LGAGTITEVCSANVCVVDPEADGEVDGEVEGDGFAEVGTTITGALHASFFPDLMQVNFLSL
jgi:hypothetical protein